MTSEILLKIRGLQMAADDSETIETICPGKYYLKNGKHYFIYEEVVEGFTETTLNKIKLKPGYMELFKKGVTNVHMVFEEGKKNQTYYYTPFGSLLIGIDTSKVIINETEESIAVEVDYAMEMNNEFVANCHISIEAGNDCRVNLSES